MKFYDLLVHSSDPGPFLEIAQRLGWSGMCFVSPWKGRAERAPRPEGKIDIAFGVEISASKAADVAKLARRARASADIVVISGSNLDVTRAAFETAEVDIVRRPWAGREDPGVNHVIARLGKKNNIAVAFEFREILHSYDSGRVSALSKMLEAARAMRKFKSPFVVSAGAQDPWDLRSPSDLLSFARFLGFQDPEANVGMSGKVLNENRKRLGGKWVMPGVEVK